MAAGTLLLLRVGSDVSYVRDVLPGLTVFGLGLALMVAPLTATVLAAAPGRERRRRQRREQRPGPGRHPARRGRAPGAGRPLRQEYADPVALDAGYRSAVVALRGPARRRRAAGVRRDPARAAGRRPGPLSRDGPSGPCGGDDASRGSRRPTLWRWRSKRRDAAHDAAVGLAASAGAGAGAVGLSVRCPDSQRTRPRQRVGLAGDETSESSGPTQPTGDGHQGRRRRRGRGRDRRPRARRRPAGPARQGPGDRARRT